MVSRRDDRPRHRSRVFFYHLLSPEPQVPPGVRVFRSLLHLCSGPIPLSKPRPKLLQFNQIRSTSMPLPPTTTLAGCLLAPGTPEFCRTRSVLPSLPIRNFRVSGLGPSAFVLMAAGILATG